MNKTETTEVMHAFADCLRLIYQKAGLKIPEAFDPAKEAERLACVLNGYVEYPCGCLAGPLEVPDYCPEHGTDQAVDEEMECLTREAGLGQEPLNPNATSVMDL